MGILVNEETPTLSFVLYTINMEYMCDVSHVSCKYRQYRRYHVVFARIYKTFQKINTRGPDTIVVEPHYFYSYIFLYQKLNKE